MSRKDEDRILHGLYYYRENIDQQLAVTRDQIIWLAAHSCADGSNWYADGELQKFDSSVIAKEFRDKLFASKVELPLRYLQYRRLITYSRTSEEIFNVAVTFAGADRAMRLHTRLGRIDVWYQERKDGIFGLAVTIAVSFMTALITLLAFDRWLGR
jgi:hypothetical protein